MNDVEAWTEQVRKAVAGRVFEVDNQSTTLTCTIGLTEVGTRIAIRRRAADGGREGLPRRDATPVATRSSSATRPRPPRRSACSTPPGCRASVPP